MRSLILKDIHRYGKHFLRCFLFIPAYRFIFFKRICERYSTYNLIGIISRLWYKNLQVKYGYQIPHKCQIGNGLRLSHYGSVVINQNARIGEDCSIAHGVTLGYVSRGKRKGTPQIGNRVWIGTNAVIVGKVTVGDDVLIAPLSYVNFDVPDSAVVMGNPGKIVSNKGSHGYLKMYK